MEEYITLMDAVSVLAERGYIIDFNIVETTLTGFRQFSSLTIPPDDFKIDKIYKCTDEDELTNTAFVFAISSKRYKLKGILINSVNGSDKDERLNDVIKKIANAFISVIKSVKYAVEIKNPKNK